MVIIVKPDKTTIASMIAKLRARSPSELVSLAYVNFFGILISIGLFILKPVKTIKLIEIRSQSIGQQAGNTALFLRRLQLEKGSGKENILYIGICATRVDNTQLLKMFRRKLWIIQNDFLVRICGNGAFIIRWLGFYLDLPFYGHEFDFDITEPDLQFTEEEERDGQKLLMMMGIGENSKFVCFHCRDSAFSKTYIQDYRNSDIGNYLDAAKYITTYNNFAIRMGQTVANPLPDLGNSRIIDYASNFRSDFGDIYVSAKCKFFLGSTAGIIVVPAIFNVPVAAADIIPFYTPWKTGDLFIPKKIWSVEEKRFLTFREMIEFGGDIRDDGIRQGLDPGTYTSKKLAEGKFIVYDNTAEEILDLAQEMNERLDGTFIITPEDEELQQRFRSLLRPFDFCYGTPARVGAKFLRENEALLR